MIDLSVDKTATTQPGPLGLASTIALYSSLSLVGLLAVVVLLIGWFIIDPSVVVTEAALPIYVQVPMPFHLVIVPAADLERGNSLFPSL